MSLVGGMPPKPPPPLPPRPPPPPPPPLPPPAGAAIGGNAQGRSDAWVRGAARPQMSGRGSRGRRGRCARGRQADRLVLHPPTPQSALPVATGTPLVQTVKEGGGCRCGWVHAAGCCGGAHRPPRGLVGWSAATAAGPPRSCVQAGMRGGVGVARATRNRSDDAQHGFIATPEVGGYV